MHLKHYLFPMLLLGFSCTVSAQIQVIGGFNPANTGSTPEDVSNTGFVVGSSPTVNSSNAFGWTQETGIFSFGTIAGGATSISADGQSLVGWSNVQFTPPRNSAFIASAPGYSRSLLSKPLVSTSLYLAAGISDDSMLVAGYFDGATATRIGRWKYWGRNV